jgi:hypothetical protein
MGTLSNTNAVAYPDVEPPQDSGRRRPPAILALFIQFVVAFIILALMVLGDAVGVSLGMLNWALLAGCLAVGGAVIARLAPWWWLIEGIFPVSIWGALQFDVPSTWYFAGFVLLFLVYGALHRSQVPLYPSSKPVYKALGALLPHRNGVRLIDLGSGLGGMLRYLSVARPDGVFFGVENALLPYWWSRRRCRRQYNCSISWGSLWKANLADYDVVYAYLSPAPMPSLWEKVQQEMRPGSLFISNTFVVPDVPPAQSISLGDLNGSVLNVWRM